jgi:hypothetical protein
MTFKTVLWGMALFCAIYIYYSTQEIHHPKGILIHNPPLQYATDAQPFQKENYTITPVQSYELEGRVLSTKNYYFGREADLSPLDLAVGWGEMSDEINVQAIPLKQTGRFALWGSGPFPLSYEAMNTQLSNMHLIPASPLLEKRLKSIKKGHIVEIKGYLVNVRAPDGWYWNSSLTRTDWSNGACELMYVTSVTIKTKP